MDSNSPIYRTRFYSDCIGVFQGGGCRAAAFGGAYAAAFKLGVRLSEVAGTSAGSIVAAFIAAGADPEFILRKMKDLRFSSLLEKPARSIFPSSSKLISFLQRVPFKSAATDSIIEVARLGGLHSSSRVESWVEGCLKELTGKQSGPVEFQDLVLPLHVVAGDLGAMKAKVWSSSTTPKQSVTHAIRASCSIPLFFQPVEEGSSLLVDGGLISNLPHFVFASNLSRGAKTGKRILLFMLLATEERKRATDLKELVAQLASLAVDGGTDVQLAFASDVARIVIPTGRIRATDFNEMDEAKTQILIENGQNAAEKFILNELLNTYSSASENFPIEDEHEAYLTVSEQMYTTRSEVKVALPDTKWFWELFPTVLQWRKMNIRIIVYIAGLAGSSADNAKEHQRRELMRGMGVELVESDGLPFRGILFDPVASSSASALTFPPERSDYEPAARFYSGRTDHAVLVALHNLLPTPQSPVISQPRSPLRLEQMNSAPLLSRLRENVQFYREPSVSLQVEEVAVSDVFLVSRFVRAFRYNQIRSLVDHYREVGLQLFEPVQIPLYGGGASFVTPPVVEETGAALVALEGNTRFLYCLNNNIPRIRVVVVRGVKAELPGKPVPLKQVRITAGKHAPSVRIEGFNHALFRDIERAVRPITD